MNEHSNEFYHASNIGGLKELHPLSKMHGGTETVCYFTPNKSYSLFYLRDMEINHVTCGIDESGIVVYHEQFPNQLAKIYNMRSGYIYSCSDNGMIKQGHTGGVWIATEPVSVEGFDFVDNVYNEILKVEQEGKVRVMRYGELMDKKRAEIVEMMKRLILKNNFLHINTTKSRFFEENFPASWHAAKREGNK
ncbi:MAG: hypothetical protein ACOX8S_07705 [Christensenellales bacterium]|jgi:hypothetical protein